jgi:hypothetical protein
MAGVLDTVPVSPSGWTDPAEVRLVGQRWPHRQHNQKSVHSIQDEQVLHFTADPATLSPTDLAQAIAALPDDPRVVFADQSV